MVDVVFVSLRASVSGVVPVLLPGSRMAPRGSFTVVHMVRMRPGLLVSWTTLGGWCVTVLSTTHALVAPMLVMVGVFLLIVISGHM